MKTTNSLQNIKMANNKNLAKNKLLIIYKIAAILNDEELISINSQKLLLDEFLNRQEFSNQTLNILSEIYSEICKIHKSGFDKYIEYKNPYVIKLLDNLKHDSTGGSIDIAYAVDNNNINLIEGMNTYGNHFINYLMSYINLKAIDNNELKIKCKELSHFIYQNHSANYIIPVIKQWFEQAKNNNDYEHIKKQLLEFLGGQRALISKLSCDEESDSFGKFSNYGNPMEDRIGSVDTTLWYGWFKILNSKVQEQYHYEKNEKLNQLESKNFNTKLSLTIFGEYGIGTWRLKPEYYDKYKEDFERPAAEYYFYYDEKKLKNDEILEILNFKCHHKPALQAVCDQIIQDIIDIIVLINPSNEKLSRDLLGLIHDFSHATVYQRGQAAITKFTVDALASMHNKKVIYSEDWTPPNANYDQQALSIFDEQEFIDYGINHLTLVDIEVVGNV